MFEAFPLQWTPIGRSSRVPRGAVRRVRVAGEDVALLRLRDGTVGALIDRCPHRGVALSLGRLGDDGTLECAFHGWRFDVRGRCSGVPLCEVPEGTRKKLGATALPVRELGGLVWIHTGREAASDLEAHPMLADPGSIKSFVVREWRTHWTRAMENMLDFPHLPFVHRATIGRGARTKMQRGLQMELEHEATSYGMDIRASLGGASLGAALQWRRPNGMVLTLGDKPGRRLLQHVFCVPIEDRLTRMIVVTTRDFGRYNPLAWLGDLFNARVLYEDQRVIESSSPPEVPDPGNERSVALDAPTLAFRKWYRRDLLAPVPSVPADRLARAS